LRLEADSVDDGTQAPDFDQDISEELDEENKVLSCQQALARQLIGLHIAFVPCCRDFLIQDLSEVRS
jgi:hypothetical protein